MKVDNTGHRHSAGRLAGAISFTTNDSQHKRKRRKRKIWDSPIANDDTFDGLHVEEDDLPNVTDWI